MKILVTVISSLVVGLSLASANFSPIHELQYILANKRRIMYSVFLSATGFVFMMTAIVIAVVESALQFDAQGFVMWSALFSASIWLTATAAIFWIGSRLMLPVRPAPAESVFADVAKQLGLADLLETFIKQTAEPMAQRPPAPESNQQNKFADIYSERNFAFDETKGADWYPH